MKTCVRVVLLIGLWLLVGCDGGRGAVEDGPQQTSDGPQATETPPAPTAGSASLPDSEPTATTVPTASATSAAPVTATAEPPTVTPVPPGAMVEIETVEDFAPFFNQDAGRTRLVLPLTTGCSSCLAGARWLEEQALAANPEADVRVYAVWFGMLPADMLPEELSGQRDESVLNDPRVIHFWDRQRLLNQWLAQNAPLEGPERSSLRRTYGQLDWGTYIWDAYFVYGPQATWREADAPLASGYPLIQNREQVRSELGMAQSAEVSAGEETATTFRILPAESFVHYGVQETFAGRSLNYAMGVTSNITGEITVDRETPANSEVGPIVVNIRDFSSDNFLRDDRIRTEFLESNRYPLATFRPTAIRAMPESYTEGETVEFEIDGELEVREVVAPATFTVSARLEGGRLTGVATTQLRMTDFGFEPPAIARLIAAEDEVDVRFEFVAVGE